MISRLRTYIIHVDWLNLIDIIQSGVMWLMQVSLMALFFVAVHHAYESVAGDDLAAAIVSMLLLFLIMAAMYALRFITARR